MGANFVVLGAAPDAQNDGVQVGAINISSSTATTVVAAVAGKRIFVHGMHLSAPATAPVTIEDVSAGATTALTGPMLLTGPLTLPWQNYPWYTCAAGDALVFANPSAAQLSGRIMYVQG